MPKGIQESGNVVGVMVEVDISKEEREQLTQMAKEVYPGMNSRKLNIIVREERPVSSTLDAGQSETEHVGHISDEDVDDPGPSPTLKTDDHSDDNDFASLNFRPLTSNSNKQNKRRISSDEDEEVPTTGRRSGKRPLKGGSIEKRSKSSREDQQLENLLTMPKTHVKWKWKQWNQMKTKLTALMKIRELVRVG